MEGSGVLNGRFQQHFQEGTPRKPGSTCRIFSSQMAIFFNHKWARGQLKYVQMRTVENQLHLQKKARDRPLNEIRMDEWEVQ